MKNLPYKRWPGTLVIFRQLCTPWILMASTLIEMPNSAKAEDARLELLRSAPLNSWIALSEDETKIVAIGNTYEEVVRNSENAGVSDPLLIMTPKVWMPISV
jgi:hypothetical protein